MVSKRAVFLVLASTAVLAGLVACGGGADSPTVTPTPGPTAAPTPTPTPLPTPALPPGMTCFPTPPPLYGIAVKVQVGTSGRKTLDSRPQVINMNGYCESVGFGGYFCFTRREDDPESQACDYLAVGQASDTGRWGPTWTADGKPCTENNDSRAARTTRKPVPGPPRATACSACAAPRSRRRRIRSGQAVGVASAASWRQKRMPVGFFFFRIDLLSHIS